MDQINWWPKDCKMKWQKGTMAELCWSGPPVAPVRVPWPHKHLKRGTQMAEYVVGRKAKGSDVYAEFAYIPMVVSDALDVKWYGTPNVPMVTRYQPFQRRGVLTIFARYPKVFERCDLVDLSTLPKVQ
jgi:hypothetical protein